MLHLATEEFKETLRFFFFWTFSEHGKILRWIYFSFSKFSSLRKFNFHDLKIKPYKITVRIHRLCTSSESSGKIWKFRSHTLQFFLLHCFKILLENSKRETETRDKILCTKSKEQTLKKKKSRHKKKKNIWRMSITICSKKLGINHLTHHMYITRFRIFKYFTLCRNTGFGT